MISKNKITNFIAFVFILSIILHTNSVYQYMGIIRNDIWSVFDCLLIGAIFFLTFKKQKYNALTLILLGFYLVTAVFLFLSNLINNGDPVAYGIKYCIFLPLAFLIFATNNKELFERMINYFIKIVFFISVISLFFFFIGDKLSILSPINKVTVQWGTPKDIDNYYFLYFVPQNDRNSGIFIEGPMYALVLSIQLFLIFLFRDIRNMKTKIMLLVTIITIITIGTLTGYLTIMLLCIFFFLNYFKRKKGFAPVFYVIIPIVSAAIVIIFLSLYESKANDLLGNLSIMQRLNDYEASFLTWLKNPIVGVGYGNEEPIIANMNVYRLTNKMTGLANSLGVFLAQGGIFATLPLLIFVIISLICGNVRKKILTILFLFLMIFCVYLYTNLFLIFYAYIIYQPINKKEKLVSTEEC